MSQTKAIMITMLVCCLGLAGVETNRRQTLLTPPSRASVYRPTEHATIRAPGRIAGLTEEIELQSQLIEPIAAIHVKQGDRVEAGTLLVTLDQDSMRYQLQLASATVQQRRAELERLRNGARKSEIATAQLEFEAATARLNSASAKLSRAMKLSEGTAISEQELEEIRFNFVSLKALAAASQNRLKTLVDPARTEDVSIAVALLRAAEANEMLARERLTKGEIRAPVEGTILEINGHVGELVGAPNSEPLIVMCNASHQRAIVDIDEFDALKVSCGQRCEVTSDSSDGMIAHGEIVEIEPRMQRKEIYGQWAGERNDTFSRRVWIDLERDEAPLPIGLPVEVRIEVEPAASL
ncbi:HlyD family secretion protein [Rhodopirellula sp. SWK7]|uniref:HlyD family secretion protein n=1 Tax=Rhodopirellula sp. SWK7 TaxID=595460 RepID=UPI0002BDA867|nr:biotin/lipoyl-binding protein [Rhodopirellula sp. SWK7]EMI44569.1 secretion protein HlyD family protein [Rhodopirellula sp. SWK7]